MDFNTIKQLDSQYIANTYKRANVLAKAGDGALVEGENIRYIDFSSGIGVNSVGFAYPGWVEAVKAQVDALAHISNLYYTEPMVKLAETLCKRTGMERAFFANSGAEANEGAIKTARKYGSDHYGPHRHEIITLQNSFHGRTLGTLAATGQDFFHQNFGPFPGGFHYAEANNLEDVLSKVNDHTCAIMVECIQGEGGVVELSPEFLAGIARVCAEKDILLVVDEIQTGVGRTGTFLCCEHYGLKPDIITLAKGLGGGLPIGAVLFGEKTKDTLGFGDHGTTFGGNPICCAGALAVLDAMDGPFLARVGDLGQRIREQVLEMPGVTGISGKGLMLGISLEEGLSAPDIINACAEKGLIVLSAKTKVRLLPPLTLTDQEADDGLAILRDVLEKEALSK